MLAGACAIAAALGETADTASILVIVLLSGVIGFAQERRAARAIDALRSLTAWRARVRRDSHMAIVPAVDVVPGDVLLLEAGDVAAADARLHDAHNPTVNKSALTGESVPAEKCADCRPGQGRTTSIPPASTALTLRTPPPRRWISTTVCRSATSWTAKADE